MNEIERGWPRWGRLQGSDLSTVPSGTLLIHPISNARAFPGRNAGSGCLRKQKVPPSPLFPPSRQGNKDDPPRKESIGEERRRIDLSPPSTLLEIRPRDLSLRGNCIRITSCHSRYHIQPSSSSSWKLLGKLLGIEIFGHPFIGSMDRLALGIFPRNVSWPPRWSCRRREILLQRVWYLYMYKRKEGLCVEFSVWNIRETWSIVNFCWDKIRNKN